LQAFWDKQEKLTQAQLAQGKKLAAPAGYGVPVEANSQVDKLYETLYGRTADRYERVALIEYIDQRREKLAKAAAAQSGEEDSVDSAAASGSRSKEKLGPARAAAFVDLVHAVANSNEFSYRF